MAKLSRLIPRFVHHYALWVAYFQPKHVVKLLHGPKQNWDSLRVIFEEPFWADLGILQKLKSELRMICMWALAILEKGQHSNVWHTNWLTHMSHMSNRSTDFAHLVGLKLQVLKYLLQTWVQNLLFLMYFDTFLRSSHRIFEPMIGYKVLQCIEMTRRL